MDFIWNAKLILMTLCLNVLLSGSEMRKAFLLQNQLLIFACKAARPDCFLCSVLDKHMQEIKPAYYQKNNGLFLSYRVHWLVANFQ